MNIKVLLVHNYRFTVLCHRRELWLNRNLGTHLSFTKEERRANWADFSTLDTRGKSDGFRISAKMFGARLTFLFLRVAFSNKECHRRRLSRHQYKRKPPSPIPSEITSQWATGTRWRRRNVSPPGNNVCRSTQPRSRTIQWNCVNREWAFSVSWTTFQCAPWVRSFSEGRYYFNAKWRHVKQRDAMIMIRIVSEISKD